MLRPSQHSVPGTWASPELKSRDHPPPPQPAREQRRAPARDSAERTSERASVASVSGRGHSQAATWGREARGSSGPGTGSPVAPSQGLRAPGHCTCTLGALRQIGRAACGPRRMGCGSLTGLRRFSVTFFQSSSCSWCRKPMAGPRSAASAPRPAPLHAPPGPAARRAARHRPRGGGALESPGPARRRLRPGGRSSRDSLIAPAPAPAPAAPAERRLGARMSARGRPGPPSLGAAAPAHSTRPLCSPGNAVFPRSVTAKI